MQFQSIIAVLSLALVATAIPTGPTTVDSGNQICESNQTAAKCSANSKTNTDGLIVVTLLNNLLGGNILNCVAVPIIPIASGNQQAANACCDTSGSQNGLINVGTLCVPIQA
ncbi:hypothetical protein MMC29_003235 [Sticta canariensis]|nr:hypothetical protein [Sticta canariensis]